MHAPANASRILISDALLRAQGWGRRGGEGGTTTRTRRRFAVRVRSPSPSLLATTLGGESSRSQRTNSVRFRDRRMHQRSRESHSKPQSSRMCNAQLLLYIVGIIPIIIYMSLSYTVHAATDPNLASLDSLARVIEKTEKTRGFDQLERDGGNGRRKAEGNTTLVALRKEQKPVVAGSPEGNPVKGAPSSTLPSSPSLLGRRDRRSR